jgi:hypothetical protein
VIPLSRPLHDKLIDAVADTLKALQLAWRERLERRRVERELDAVADMNEVLLRDIGAPEWMISKAAAQRDIDRTRLLQAYQGARFDQ